MASLIYNKYRKAALDGGIDLVNDTIKLMLVTASYTPDQDNHDFIDDVSANEVSSSGYTAGGQALGTKTNTQDNTNDLGVFDAADLTWTAVTFSTRYGVLYKDTGTPSTSPLIACFDWGATKSPAAEDFTVVWNASGILQLA